jgi:hypothetical protein
MPGVVPAAERRLWVSSDTDPGRSDEAEVEGLDEEIPALLKQRECQVFAAGRQGAARGAVEVLEVEGHEPRRLPGGEPRGALAVAPGPAEAVQGHGEARAFDVEPEVAVGRQPLQDPRQALGVSELAEHQSGDFGIRAELAPTAGRQVFAWCAWRPPVRTRSTTRSRSLKRAREVGRPSSAPVATS